MTLIVDYRMGNLGSIRNMLKKINQETTIGSSPEQVINAKRLILPGVGRFDQAMENLEKMDLLSALHQKKQEGQTPILGICLGMQLMTTGSEEGDRQGLNWFPGQVRKFKFPEDPTMRVPHMGWNELNVKKAQPLLHDLNADSRYYFVHSYYVELERKEEIAATTTYGNEFVSVLGQGKIWGAQFHPEKSHRYGMALLNNFFTGVPL